MEIKFANPTQVAIADLLWNASTIEDAENIVAKYGVDGIIVRDMIIAESLDEDMDVEVGALALQKFQL